MLDSLSLNPFKFSDAGKKKGSPFGFHMLKKGNTLIDGVTGTSASCSISGARWGIVNGIVSQFAANVPRIEDEGLGACPAFTQFCTHTESLATSWTQNNLSIVEMPLFQGVSMHKLIENTANASHGLTRSAFATADSSIIGFRCKCKSDGRDFQLKALLKTNSWVALCRVDFGSGTIVNKHASVKASNILSIDDGFYDVFVAYDVGIGTSDPRLFPELHNGVSEIYTGNGVSGIYFAQPTMVNYGVNGVPFIPPYVPNNTSSSISVVSEAATSTTGTSFDLDLPALSRLKAGLRGKAIGANLWTTPTFVTPPWTDNGTHYVCDGTATYSPATATCVQTGKFYEIEFTTGSVTTTSGIIVYIGAQVVFDGTLSANTKYVLRNSSATTSANVAFSSGAGFVGQISKNIIVREVQAQGHFELEVESNIDSGWFPTGSITTINLINVNNDYTGDLLYIKKDTDGTVRFSCFVDSSIAAVNSTISLGQIYKIAIDYGTYTDGAQKMRLTVDGVKSSVVAFSGSFGTQDLKFFYGSLVHAFFIKLGSFKFIPKPIW